MKQGNSIGLLPHPLHIGCAAPGKTARNKKRRYVCPGCGAAATANRDINLVCGNCRFDMWRR